MIVTKPFMTSGLRLQRGLSQFIWKYEQNIFSRRQLDKLFELNGSKNPEKKPLTTGYDRGVEPFATRHGQSTAAPV